jgi:pimeloyl-ACP methyl ester carboxylesterase
LSAVAQKPFRIAIPDETLDDLKQRLSRVRWPDEAPDGPWRYGSSVAYMQELVAYWRDAYDWRAHERDLNGFAHFTAPVDGIDIHFIHEKGLGPKPLPLLLSHGWPGSIVEFRQLIPMLTDPARFGADPADAFTVVAPSLPGYAFSFAENQKRVGVTAIADMFAALMSNVLGYARFGAQGGDWGGFITSCLGYAYPERMIGIHLNFLAVPRDPKAVAELNAEERTYFQTLAAWMKEETGYQWIQGTRPQTLSFGLTDSPVGLAAWIVEKFRAWSDCGGDVERAFSKDTMLTNIMLYWVTGAINSSFWPYYDRRHSPWPIPAGARIAVPMGYAAFPHEIVRPPRSLAERMYDIRRWTDMPAGGHFAALEQPEALAAEIRAFFRPLRSV